MPRAKKVLPSPSRVSTFNIVVCVIIALCLVVLFFNVIMLYSFVSSEFNLSDFRLERYLDSRIYFPASRLHSNTYVLHHDNGTEFKYTTSSPIVFVGGAPRSGTTLMRAILDTHDEIHCGPETHLFPELLKVLNRWAYGNITASRLDGAGLNRELLLSVLGSVGMEIIVGQKRSKPPTKYLCNKDPITSRYIPLLFEAFPNAKVIQMIRDGRAMVHSTIKRKVRIATWNLNDTEQCLRQWNIMTSKMYPDCTAKKDRCLQVPYELLVQYPEVWTRKVAAFIGIPWDLKMLSHSDFIGNTTLVAPMERSSDQIVKPIYSSAMDEWVGTYSPDVLRRMHKIAPNLAKWGYDPFANPPDYSKFEIRDLTQEADKKQAELLIE